MIIVAISVFSLFHPVEFDLKPAQASVVIVNQNGHRQTLEGSLSMKLRAPAIATGRDGSETDFILSIPGRIHRHFRGTLEVHQDDGHLIAIVMMTRETAVASIVAAESPPGAPLEARKAQAVVARSFLAASHGRHQGFDFCDTTHCQFLRDVPPSGSVNAIAAAETHDLVITYQGAVVPALYSANCGGHTRTLAEAGWKEEGYPYFAVECPVRERVSGHRIGMCQEGAAQLAREGKTFREILAYYFPATAVTLNTDAHAGW